jgi:hypothetical protein
VIAWAGPTAVAHRPPFCSRLCLFHAKRRRRVVLHWGLTDSMPATLSHATQPVRRRSERWATKGRMGLVLAQEHLASRVAGVRGQAQRKRSCGPGLGLREGVNSEVRMEQSASSRCLTDCRMLFLEATREPPHTPRDALHPLVGCDTARVWANASQPSPSRSRVRWRGPIADTGLASFGHRQPQPAPARCSTSLRWAACGIIDVVPRTASSAVGACLPQAKLWDAAAQ